MWIGIVTIICIVIFLCSMLGVYIYKKFKHLPTGDCAYCSFNNKNKLLKEYHKKYGKNNSYKCKNCTK